MKVALWVRQTRWVERRLTWSPVRSWTPAVTPNHQHFWVSHCLPELEQNGYTCVRSLTVSRLFALPWWSLIKLEVQRDSDSANGRWPWRADMWWGKEQLHVTHGWGAARGQRQTPVCVVFFSQCFSHPLRRRQQPGKYAEVCSINQCYCFQIDKSNEICIALMCFFFPSFF